MVAGWRPSHRQIRFGPLDFQDVLRRVGEYGEHVPQLVPRLARLADDRHHPILVRPQAPHVDDLPDGERHRRMLPSTAEPVKPPDT